MGLFQIFLKSLVGGDTWLLLKEHYPFKNQTTQHPGTFLSQ